MNEGLENSTTDINAIPDPTLEKEVIKSPEQLLVEAIKDYSFLSYSAGILKVDHKELKAFLKLKTLKMGDIVKRGTILANLNGGVSNMDQETLSLNSCLATVSVGFQEPLKLNLLDVEDTDLITGLYVAVNFYNKFFRQTPLGLTL